jgi:hypothetical protein
LYWPAEDVDELTNTDAPDVVTHDYDGLDRDERIHAMRLMLTERALERNGGRLRMDASELNQYAFDGVAPDSTVRDMFDAAATGDGFETRRVRGVKHLYVDFDDVTDMDLIEDVNRLQQASESANSGPSASASSSSATATAATDGGTDRESIDDEFDRLMSAEQVKG